MDLTRTTIRIPPALKKKAQKVALDEDKSLQDLITEALEQFMQKKAVKKAKKIVFHAQHLGVNLDNLTRADYYDD